MAISTKGKRPLTVDGEQFFWRYWNGGAHVVDRQGKLNAYFYKGLVLVKGPRFRAVKGCGGLQRVFRCPDFFQVACWPRQVAKCVRWAVRPTRDPEEVDRHEFQMSKRPRRARR